MAQILTSGVNKYESLDLEENKMQIDHRMTSKLLVYLNNDQVSQ